MKKTILAAAAAALLSTSAMATESQAPIPMEGSPYLSVTAYIMDEGDAATFADGLDNGYFANTVENKIEYFFATGGAWDTNAGVLTGYYNARGNTVYQLEATDFDTDVVIKYRPIQGNMRLEYNGNYIIAETVVHLEEWLRMNPETIGHPDTAGLLSWLVDANADFNRGEHWVAALTEAVS